MNTGKKKSGVAGFVILAVMFFAFGIFYVVSDVKDLISPTRDILDIIDEDGDIEDGEFVNMGVDAVLDWYAETKHTVNYIPVGKEQHCVIWLDDYTFISMTVKKKDIDEIDELIDKTWGYIDGETDDWPSPIIFSGRIRKMDSEVLKYYNECIDDIVTDRSGCTIYAFTVDTTQSKVKTWLWIIALFAIGAAFTVGAVVKSKHNKEYDQAQDQAHYGPVDGDRINVQPGDFSTSEGQYQSGNTTNTYQNNGSYPGNGTYQNNGAYPDNGTYQDPYSDPYRTQTDNMDNNDQNKF